MIRLAHVCIRGVIARHVSDKAQLDPCTVTDDTDVSITTVSGASRLITEANDYAVHALPKEFRELVRGGLAEARKKNFQLALDLLQDSITFLPDPNANQEHRDAVSYYVDEIKTKMQFIENTEPSKSPTLESRAVRELYKITCKQSPLPSKHIASILHLLAQENHSLSKASTRRNKGLQKTETTSSPV